MSVGAAFAFFNDKTKSDYFNLDEWKAAKFPNQPKTTKEETETKKSEPPLENWIVDPLGTDEHLV